MRLIDADAFADELLGYIFERGQASGLWEEQLERDMITYADIEYAKGYDYALEEFYRNLTISRPTVEAIPIDWLVTKAKEMVLTQGTKFYSLLDLPIVYDLIEEWKKENELR